MVFGESFRSGCGDFEVVVMGNGGVWCSLSLCEKSCSSMIGAWICIQWGRSTDRGCAMRVVLGVACLVLGVVLVSQHTFVGCSG